MTARFRSSRHGPTARFAAAEVVLLELLFTDLLGLLDERADAPEEASADAAEIAELEEMTGMGGGSGPESAPADPVLSRLFPDAYRDDEKLASEFRRLTERELRDGKVAAIRALLDDLPSGGGRVTLADEDAALAWLTALNDLRLALGTRLGVTDETYAELEQLDASPDASPDEPNDDMRVPQLAVYGWLGYLQETLVGTLLR